MVLGALCCATLRTPGVQLAKGPTRMVDTLRQGRSQLRTKSVACGVSDNESGVHPVILTPTFYAIYAAEFLSATINDDQFWCSSVSACSPEFRCGG